MSGYGLEAFLLPPNNLLYIVSILLCLDTVWKTTLRLTAPARSYCFNPLMSGYGLEVDQKRQIEIVR